MRLYAEDPAQGFLPQSGEVLLWRAPAGEGVRVDAALKSRDQVSPHYDPMIAKIMAHGATREEARERLVAAVARAGLLGIVTNQSFLVSMLRHPAFAAGAATTAFIGTHYPLGCDALKPAPATPEATALAAALLLAASGEIPNSSLAGWCSTGVAAAPMQIDLGDGRGRRLHVDVETPRRYVVRDGASSIRIELPAVKPSAAKSFDDIGRESGRSITAVIDGRTCTAEAAFTDNALHLALDETRVVARDRLREARSIAEDEGGGQLHAPMNGRVVRLAAKIGETVKKGQCIVVLEAMKMQHEITAPRDGTLARLSVTQGQQVATRAVLAELE